MLLRKQIFGLALGYENLNLHERLRLDPLFVTVCGRVAVFGRRRHHCYLPFECFCADIPLWPLLRTSDRDSCEGALPALQKIVDALRQRFGQSLLIMMRRDSGFAAMNS